MKSFSYAFLVLHFVGRILGSGNYAVVGIEYRAYRDLAYITLASMPLSVSLF